MSPDLIALGVLTGVGAVWLATHLALVLWTVAGSKLGLFWRLIALLPPLTPVAAWKRGSRVFPILWLVFGATYVVLRFVL